MFIGSGVFAGRCMFAALTSMVFLAGTANAAVVISSAQTANMSCLGGVCAPTATDAVLNAGDLETLLASGSVEVTTTGSGGVQAENIEVRAALSWSSAASLVLDADNSIVIGKPVSVKKQGGLSLVTNDGGSTGTLSFGAKGHASFANLSSSLTINRRPYTLVNSIAALADAIAGNPSGSFALAADYDAAGDGTYTASPIPMLLGGTVEGLANRISNVTVAVREDSVQVGLFSGVGTDGIVSDLGLIAAKVDVSGKDDAVGGLVGSNSGGLIGDFMQGTVSGSELGTLGAYTGGLVGNSSGEIRNSHANATVHGKEQAYVGGLIGAQSGGEIVDSYATGNVTGLGTCAGGLAGYAGTISGSFATGKITAKSPARGGLAGCGAGGTISNSYAMGLVRSENGDGAMDGGLIGNDLYGGHGGGAIITSYSAGSVPVADGSIEGGFAGAVQNSGAATNDYWDLTASGTSQGVGEGSSSGITGLTSKQLRSGLPSGFDPAIWAEKRDINNGLPYLLANPPAK
jgi:hypothetical protein